jgi:hypothetical protein
MLLQVLHSTRALDSTLAVFTSYYAISVPRPSLGGYLRELTRHHVPGLGLLRESDRAQYKRTIVDKRNLYMHEAGTFPSRGEISFLLSEMHACLARVLAL